MFDSLKDKLQSVFSGLGRKGALSEADVDAALKEVRLALLEADVALPVVREFMADIRDKAVGASVLKSVRPDQQVIKLVHDGLVDMLGRDAAPLMVDVAPPAVIVMAGLQGSGKTTTAGKLAHRLKTRQRKKVMLASLDLTRPAAREQLRSLSEQAEAGILPESDTETPVQLARRALQAASLSAYDVLILDTAGRLSIDEALMAELREIVAVTNPHEILLVADSLTGQDAVQTASAFNEAVNVTGIVLTRLDGDARGGAALSMTKVTGCPVKLVGTGEKLDALEEFHPDRMAGRILDMGDVVALVEKAAEAIEEEEAARLAQRMASGQFDMNDFLAQLKQLQKMGGLGSIMGMLPGLGKLQKQIAAAGVDDSMIKRQEAIILSRPYPIALLLLQTCTMIAPSSLPTSLASLPGARSESLRKYLRSWNQSFLTLTQRQRNRVFSRSKPLEIAVSIVDIEIVMSLATLANNALRARFNIGHPFS